MWNDPPKAATASLAETSGDHQQLLVLQASGVSSDFPATSPSAFPPRQIGSSFSRPIKTLLIPLTSVLNEGQGRACPSFLTDLPALELPVLPGKMASLVGCVCVHSAIPCGQVPSDESVGAFEIVRETDFLVKSCPVQLEGQILLSC